MSRKSIIFFSVCLLIIVFLIGYTNTSKNPDDEKGEIGSVKILKRIDKSTINDIINKEVN